MSVALYIYICMYVSIYSHFDVPVWIFIHRLADSFVTSTRLYIAEDVEYSEAHFSGPASGGSITLQKNYNTLIASDVGLEALSWWRSPGGGGVGKFTVEDRAVRRTFRPPQYVYLDRS